MQSIDHYQDWLVRFVRESNRIEGIYREDVFSDVAALDEFLRPPQINVGHLGYYVSVIQPDAVLRDRVGLDVEINGYLAPLGCPEIRDGLVSILNDMGSPFRAHVRYEQLHPFTDGNGRSGRALWLWQMLHTQESERAKQLGFLHTFYYQTLSAGHPS